MSWAPHPSMVHVTAARRWRRGSTGWISVRRQPKKPLAFPSSVASSDVRRRRRGDHLRSCRLLAAGGSIIAPVGTFTLVLRVSLLDGRGNRFDDHVVLAVLQAGGPAGWPADHGRLRWQVEHLLATFRQTIDAFVEGSSGSARPRSCRFATRRSRAHAIAASCSGTSCARPRATSCRQACSIAAPCGSLPHATGPVPSCSTTSTPTSCASWNPATRRRVRAAFWP